jgi:hypothetical protein
LEIVHDTQVGDKGKEFVIGLEVHGMEREFLAVDEEGFETGIDRILADLCLGTGIWHVFHEETANEKQDVSYLDLAKATSDHDGFCARAVFGPETAPLGRTQKSSGYLHHRCRLR